MESFTDILTKDASTWSALIPTVEELWFEPATKLGEGENCAVYSLGYAQAGEAWASDTDDSGLSDGNYSSDSYFEDSDEEEEDEDEEEEDEDEDEDEDEEKAVVMEIESDEEATRVYRDCATGRSQAVVKVFRHLDEEACVALWDTEQDIPVRVFNDEDECVDWKRMHQMHEDARYEPRVLTTHLSSSTGI
jgi:hypothetical protein